MSKKGSERDSFYFEGFDGPNGTIVPDVFFDRLAPMLGEAELRVLLYIIRRTFGFKKNQDDISLRQLVEGITTRSGEILDLGAGVGKPAVIRAVKALEQKGIIMKRSNRSKERGDEATTYALRFRGGPVFSKDTRGGIPTEHPRVSEENTQQTEEQTTVEQQTEDSKETERDLHKDFSTFNVKREVRKQTISKQSSMYPSPGDATDGPEHPTGWADAGSVLAARLPQAPASVGPSGGARRGRPPKPTPLIANTVEDIGLKLRDEAPRSSVTRAMRLFAASGLSEADFVYHVLHPAKATVWQHADVKRHSAGDTKLPNRMPLFFAEVERQLDLRDRSDWTKQRGASS